MFKLSTSSLTLGLIVAGGLALANVASASESEAFSMKQLAHGYSQVQADGTENPLKVNAAKASAAPANEPCAGPSSPASLTEWRSSP